MAKIYISRERKLIYYAGLAFQLVGFLLVGICLITGLIVGDYSKLELIQFVVGTASFYFGNYIREKTTS